jgi:hypothetical protein
MLPLLLWVLSWVAWVLLPCWLLSLLTISIKHYNAAFTFAVALLLFRFYDLILRCQVSVWFLRFYEDYPPGQAFLLYWVDGCFFSVFFLVSLC